MAFTLNAGIPLGSKSGVGNTQLHPRLDAEHNNYHPRDSRNHRNNNLWFCTQYMEWRKYRPYLSLLWRTCRLRFGLHDTHSWRSLLVRSNNKSCKPSIISNRNRKRDRYYFYYYILIYILAIGLPSYAEEGETNNTSNPVAAATGNVTNQAVQFQNNGAPSRQHMGPNISCNGPTMTFSPFYMGNHVEPYDYEEGEREQSSYTKNENWGGQINFMFPLDGEMTERCKSISKRQEEKMQLDYELVRALKCAELMKQGFMIRPKTRVYHLCSDIIPIVAYQKEVKEQQSNPLLNPIYNDSTNQTSPFRIHQVDSSETTDSRPFRRFSLIY